MAFCKFSSEVVANNKIELSNAFVKEFLPQANSECVKVYIYGLFLCNNPANTDNSLESFARMLNMTEDDVISAFYYWQEVNLVQVLSVEPIEVRYLPVKNYSALLKKYNKDKYKNFNIQAQEIIIGRMITPNEYQEYYHLIESLHIEENALIKIIKYCVDLKGENVGYSYITAVAKSWAYEGILTEADVIERLEEQERSSNDIKLVLKTLGIRRSASTEEYQLFLTWTRDFGYPLDTIVFVAKLEKKSGSMLKLNKTLTRCFEQNLTSIKEIEDYLNNLTSLYDTARVVCAKIGQRYDNLENVVDTYINPWFMLGFDNNCLVNVANYCFKSNIKTLEGMNSLVNKLFKLGILTAESLDNYLSKSLEHDDDIKKVLDNLGLIREVNSVDRKLYSTWKSAWNISDELLTYACGLSADKVQPMQYLNKILSQYVTNKITTVEEAKKLSPSFKSTSDNKPRVGREYSAKELNSLFDSIEEVEL